MSINKKVINENNYSKTKRGKRKRLTEHRESNSILNNKVEKAKQRLFQVKHAKNKDLYGTEETEGGHFVLITAYDYKNDNVGVNVITSIDDSIKIKQTRNGLTIPIDVTGLSRKAGLKQEVITKNKCSNKNVNYEMLEDTKNNSILLGPNMIMINEFIYENNMHRKKSEANKRRTKGYIKKTNTR